MNNVIYSKVTRPISQAPDGDTPSIVFVTEEANGWHVWFSSYESGIDHLKAFLYSKSDAIEYGVDTARKLTAAAKYAEAGGGQ